MNAASTAKLQSVFRAVFDRPEDADVTSLRQIADPKWDSLAQVSLMAAIESEFGVQLDAADALRMTSYRATELLLDEKGL